MSQAIARTRAAQLLWLGLPFLMLSACRKPDPDQGLDILPGDPLGVVVDTAAVHAFTIRDSVVRTSGLSRHLLGAYRDPQFGLVRAGIVTQWRLPSNNIGLGVDPSGLVADSLVLALAFDGPNATYGNLDPQVFRAHELAEPLSLDSAYYVYTAPDLTGDDLVLDRGGRLKPAPNVPVTIDGATQVPQLRIRLSPGLAERFLDAFGSSSFTSNDAFLSFFKGIYISVDAEGLLPNQGGVFIFDLLSANSKATLYYRNTNGSNAPERLDFLINSNCVRYTTVEHDLSLAVDQTLQDALADTTSPAATVHLQALGGLRTAIRLPGIAQYAVPGRILAKAELVVPVRGSHYPFYPPPAQIILFRKGSAGTDVFLPDQLNGIGAIDGRYRPDERAYRFNITRYVQKVISGEYPNNGFTLVVNGSGVTANRVVLCGPAATGPAMRLRLTFTTY